MGSRRGRDRGRMFLKDFTESYSWVHLDHRGDRLLGNRSRCLPKVPRACPSARSWSLYRAGALTPRRFRLRRLGLVAGPFCTRECGQQPPRDTIAVPRDSAPADTIRTQRDPVVRRDTIKAALARAELPATVDAAGRYHWTRDELFVGGGLTLFELLERVPLVTGFRSGWMASPAHVTWLGGGGRVRVFYDGIEMEPFDARTGGLLDLGEIQLWTLEEVLVERGADELRIHLRSWRVERTSTASRTDIFTGDEDTNVYRGFIGRRLAHGEALQGGFQQYGTISTPSGGGDELSLVAGRLGSEGVDVDGFGIRARRQRNMQRRDDDYQIPRVNSSSAM